MENLNNIREKVESTYAAINHFTSEGVLPLLDMAYPEHDGKQDAYVVSDMMSLRDSLHSLIAACQYSINNLNEAIND